MSYWKLDGFAQLRHLTMQLESCILVPLKNSFSFSIYKSKIF
jgi:hypothetical protein